MGHDLHTNDLNKASMPTGTIKGSMLTKLFKITKEPPYRPKLVAGNPTLRGAQAVSGGVAGVSPQMVKEQKLGKKKCCG